MGCSLIKTSTLGLWEGPLKLQVYECLEEDTHGSVREEESEKVSKGPSTNSDFSWLVRKRGVVPLTTESCIVGNTERDGNGRTGG